MNRKCYCGQLFSIIIFLTYTTVFFKPLYTHFLKNSTQGPVLIVMIRWDPCFSKSHRAILGRNMVYVWIGFYMIYRLHVIYSDKVLFSMFINVKCLLWCDPDCYFRLLSALPVKIFKIAMPFYRSLVYMRPIFCRCFLFLIIGNMLWKQMHNQNKLISLSFCTSTDFSVYIKLVPVQLFKALLLFFARKAFVSNMSFTV